MTTIPLPAASYLLATRPDLKAALQSCGRQVGGRVELDLNAVAQISPDLVGPLREFSAKTHEALADGEATNGVRTQRWVRDAKQISTRDKKTDLTRELAALQMVPATAELITYLTGPDPDEEEVVELARMVGARVERDEKGVWQVDVPLVGDITWPSELGGVKYSTEVGRFVSFTVRQAAWRDRRVRRLTRVRVAIEEMWCDPHRFRQALPAAV